MRKRDLRRSIAKNASISLDLELSLELVFPLLRRLGNSGRLF
jgi:hypothetical protein